VRRLFTAWNGLGGQIASPSLEGLDAAEWAAHGQRWRDRLAARLDLTAALIAFVASKG